MRISDWINIVLCVLSFLLAAISVITVVVTLKQNHKMIENSTRPYIIVKYEAVVMPNGMARYIVVKNYGQTGAKIISMQVNGDTNDLFDRQFMKAQGTFLAPSQRLLYYFGGVNTGAPEVLSFHYTYTANGKTYSESTELTLINGAACTRPTGDDAARYALQDIAERLI